MLELIGAWFRCLVRTRRRSRLPHQFHIQLGLIYVGPARSVVVEWKCGSECNFYDFMICFFCCRCPLRSIQVSVELLMLAPWTFIGKCEELVLLLSQIHLSVDGNNGANDPGREAAAFYRNEHCGTICPEDFPRFIERTWRFRWETLTISMENMEISSENLKKCQGSH